METIAIGQVYEATALNDLSYVNPEAAHGDGGDYRTAPRRVTVIEVNEIGRGGKREVRISDNRKPMRTWMRADRLATWKRIEAA